MEGGGVGMEKEQARCRGKEERTNAEKEVLL